MRTFPFRAAVASALVAILTSAGLAAGTPTAAYGEPTPTPGDDLFAPAGGPSGVHQITLLTGDVVELSLAGDGQSQVTIAEPARRADGSIVESFDTSREPDGVYVIPSDAAPAIQAGWLDRELFNVSYLAEHGLTDAASGQLPVIVQHRPTVQNRPAAALPAATETATLASIDAVGMRVDRTAAAEFWAAVNPPASTSPAAAAVSLAGVRGIWLDRELSVSLDESVPLVGAPQAWDAGFDGTGVTVAVLDTGIDDTHPDLAGKVDAAQSFVDGPPVDGHGHGTHVAATVAGTGAGSDGRFTGVAPGARLLNGKVCTDSGGCQFSDVIAGMEWAAGEQDADILSISLGGCCTDGTDPVSQAVNQLTADTGALFVIAAGNDGPGAGTVATPGVADAALTVAATDKSDQLASFSSRGPRLDGALKPDIAAPGVSITAARAAGTGMGTPVDELYTTASGTSMATPHVSGAAAILAQQRPDWTPEELKAALMSTAADAGHTSYEQGAGRLDVARAVTQPVVATTHHLDFGQLPTGDNPEPVSLPVEYRNLGEAPVELTLTPTLRDTAGEPAPGGALTVDSTVTVPAGGTASVTATLDPAVLNPGTYTGHLVATSQDSQVRLATPIGADGRSTLTIHVIDNGEPGFSVGNLIAVAVDLPGPTGQPSTADLIPRATAGTGNRAAGRTAEAGDVHATFQYRVPPGTYSAWAGAHWRNDSQEDRAVLLAPEFDVSGDTEIFLDARDVEEITFDTSRPVVTRMVAFATERSLASGFVFSNVKLPTAPFNIQSRKWVTPTGPAETGLFRFATQVELANPQLSVSVRTPERIELHPAFGCYEYQVGLRCPDIDRGWVPFAPGSHRLELVDAGLGRESDLAGLDLTGKLALIRCGPGGHPEYAGCHGGGGTPPHFGIYHRIQRLQEAGAAGYVLAPIQESGLQPGMTNYSPQLPQVQIPEVLLRASEGDLLADLLADGPVTLDLASDPELRYSYQLKAYEEQQISDDLTYPAGDRDLARVDMDVHAFVDELTRAGAAWHAFKPQGNHSALAATGLAAPLTLPTFFGPLTDDAIWWGGYHFRDGSSPQRVLTPFRVFDRPVRTSEQMRVVPYAPGAASLGDVHTARPGDPFSWELCAMCREGDTFVPFYYPVAGNGQYQSRGLVSLAMEMFTADGEPIPITMTGGFLPSFVLPEEAGTYRLVHHDPASGADTTWTFQSARPGGDQPPAAYHCSGPVFSLSLGPCQAEPLLSLRYDLGDQLQLDNTIPVPGAHRFRVSVLHHPGADLPRIAGLRLWTSTDGGESWERVRVLIPRDRGTDGARTFDAVVVYPRLGETSGTVSLRAEAWDTAGNRVEQTIPDAFGLTDRR